MKIILVNYRYFISGGPERYYFNIKEILERNGHVVIPFSVKNSRNFSSDYETYFLDRLDDEVYFAHSNKKSMKVILKSFSRMFYSFEAKRKFRQLLTDTNPDLVYIMQYHNKISPSIIDAAKNLGIPVIHRISDYGLFRHKTRSKDAARCDAYHSKDRCFCSAIFLHLGKIGGVWHFSTKIASHSHFL